MTGDIFLDTIVVGLLTVLATLGGLLIAVSWAVSIISSSHHLDDE